MPITGTCPYDGCDGKLWIAFDEEHAKLPAFHKHPCETCGKTIWTYVSRIDPHSYTEAGFLEKFEVDEDKKSIKEKI